MLEIGERLPDFVLPLADGSLARFYGRAGGTPTALVLPGSGTGTKHAEALASAFGQRDDVAVHWVVRDRQALPAGVDGFIDVDGAVTERIGADPTVGTILVLDSNLRVVAVETYDVDADRVLAVLIDVAGVRSSRAGSVASQAPILMVPRVVDPDLAGALIEQCRIESVVTGVERSVGGVDSVDPGLKRRRDVTVTDPKQLRELSAAVGKRVMPEVQRAFAFRATRFEGFKIGWYDEEYGGFFAAHRDNLTPATAHRVFGLSINLNDGYGGGDLLFPEYGDERYRAPVGAAMVFSSSLLHGVSPVVTGSRFVLLSFLSA